MKITFWGAAQTVTGSMHHLEIAGKRYLLDCGLYQGHRKDAEHRNRDLPFDARSITSVVLSHAHIDHSGNLPTLVRNGFAGPIYTTPPTIDLCESMLRDTAHIQESDTRFVNKRSERRHRNGHEAVQPLYTMEDAEQTLLLLHQLTNENRIPPRIPLFVDSPLAVNVTEAFRKNTDYFDAEARAYLRNGGDPFGFGMLTYIREASESKKLNELRGPIVVISASGMCEAGRILHHLRNNIEDPRNTVLITGFQAENTLGRKLVERWAEVNIFGEPMRVRAEVASLLELSGHADQGELLEWLAPITPGLKKIFLV